MPSRPAVAAIVLFWLGTAGYLVVTQLLPWLTAAEQPTVWVSAVDEAGRQKVRWNILYNGKKAGSLVSEMKPDTGGDFTFVAKYSDVRFPLLGGELQLPTATSEVTVDRAGRLRKQSFAFALAAKHPLFPNAMTGNGTIAATVTDGMLSGRASGEVLGVRIDPMDLPPVPVADGQVLNPMLPVNRLKGVTPGKRWRIQLTDPLGDSVQLLFQALLKKYGPDTKLLGGGGPREAVELLAEVEADTVALTGFRLDPEVTCHVIVYRGKDNKEKARTWVSAADGRVMRQQATLDSNTIRLDRDE